jgi:hypothetical protein
MGDDHSLKQKSQRVNLSKFELSQSQSIIVLIFALTGLFLLPYFLAEEIFGNLYVELLEWFPRNLSNPEYSAITYFYYQLLPIIANIIIYGFFFYLSFITVRKILQGLGGEGFQKSKIIPQDRIVRWFGLKLSHGQAIFIFSLSIIGIPFLILRIMGIGNPPSFMFYRSLLLIPSGQYSHRSNEFLFNNAHFILDGFFFILCLYSIFATRRRKKSNSDQLKTASNYSILIFIVSFVTFLLYLVRLFSHLLTFTDLAYLVGAPYPTSSYQFNDFLNVVIILIVSSSFLVFSYFLKKRTNKENKEKEPLMWFYLKLTKNRFIMLLSYIIMYPCLIIYFFTTEFFTFGPSANEGDLIPLYSIIFLLILYSFYIISNKSTFQRILTQFNDSEDFQTNWLNFKVNRLQSVILGSISSGAMFFYVFIMFGFRSIFNLLIPVEILTFVQLISVLAFLSILLIFAFYTIKCTYKGVKSR